MLPEMNALIATDVISGRFSGHIALNEPIIMPSELGLAKPQMANVAIAELRNCGKEKHVNCNDRLTHPDHLSVGRRHF